MYRYLLRLMLILGSAITLLITALTALPRRGVAPPLPMVAVFRLHLYEDVITMRFDGYSSRPIDFPYRVQWTPLWSPDGQWILITEDSQFGYIRRIQSDGDEIDPVTEGFWYLNIIGWSPDSQWILFTADQDTRAYVVRPDGSELHPITDPCGVCGRFVWSPDGNWIIFQSNDGIHRMRPDGSEQQLILAGEMLDYGRHVWSPDGEWLAITLPDESAESFPYLLKSDGSERRLLSEYPITGTPAWSPDAQWIIFIHREDRNFNMYRIHPDGSNLQQIMSRPGPATLISWSPDSQWIVFHTDQSFESEGLYRMRADGTDCQMLANVATGPVSWGPPLNNSYHPAIPLILGGMMLITALTPWQRLRHRRA